MQSTVQATQTPSAQLPTTLSPTAYCLCVAELFLAVVLHRMIACIPPPIATCMRVGLAVSLKLLLARAAAHSPQQQSRMFSHLAPFAGHAAPSDARYTVGVLPDGTGGWLQHRLDLDTPGSGPGVDWIKDVMPLLESAKHFRPAGALKTHPPRILVLYGSLRLPKSFSRFLALECARILELLGADVRVFDPHALPVREYASSPAHCPSSLCSLAAQTSRSTSR